MFKCLKRDELMARGVNKVILIGNMGQDPELRTPPDGKSFCTISIATGDTWKDKVTGEPVERTEWHRVKLFGKRAEAANLYTKKGTKIYIEGSLQTRKYTDKAGIERYITEILCNDFQILDSKPKNNNQEDIQQESPVESSAIPYDDIPF